MGENIIQKNIENDEKVNEEISTTLKNQLAPNLINISNKVETYKSSSNQFYNTIKSITSEELPVNLAKNHQNLQNDGQKFKINHIEETCEKSLKPLFVELGQNFENFDKSLVENLGKIETSAKKVAKTNSKFDEVLSQRYLNQILTEELN